MELEADYCCRRVGGHGQLLGANGENGEQVAVRVVTLWRAGAAVAGHTVVGAHLERSRRQLSRSWIARVEYKLAYANGDVDDDPVPEAATRRSVGIKAGQSFALTCFDPDAPTGSGFWHWVVVNIPVGVSELVLDAGNPGSGKLPAGALQVRTDYGMPGYGGPCPPQGDHPHRYLFTIFAVGAEQLPVTADTSAAVVGFQLHFNTLAKAELMGLFKH